MARVRSFQRPTRQRVVGRKVVIACEGKKTEYGYFNSIRQSMRLPTLQVIVVRPEGTDPLTVVRTALEYKLIREDENSWTEEDSAWAVFDGDEHKLANPNNWNKAIQIAEGNDINLAISNPCFEFWYLLHYREYARNLSRTHARRLLKQHISRYEKADVLWPIPLKPLTAVAIERARRLAKFALSNGLELHTNPCSGVFKLVENLLALEQGIRG